MTTEKLYWADPFATTFEAEARAGRVGEADDIGSAAAALMRPGAGWITGQRVEASGGMFL